MRKINFITQTLLLTAIFSLSAVAQNDVKITKKIRMKMPGMEKMSELPAKMQESFAERFNRTATVYLKNSRMRTDMPYQTIGLGGMKTRTMTTIMQCDTNRLITFNNQKKKYYVEDSGVSAKSRKGGFVTFAMTTTDTGEKLKLFGFDARHIKQKIVVTPSANACQKTAIQIETDGWYADIPSFSCPLKPDVTQMQAENNCFDEVLYEMKGAAVTGVAVKEIKTIKAEGQTFTMEEEVTDLVRTSLDAAMFEPPADYKAADSKADAMNDGQTSQNENISSPITANQTSSNTPNPTLAPPIAGIASDTTLQSKKAGLIRIGIAKPKVTTPESKKDASAGADIADAVTKSLLESFKTETVEAIQLTSAAPETEAKEKDCDYIFYANVTQKRGGGGMFKSMVLQGAIMAGGMLVPGIGGIIASTVAGQVMGQTMGKAAKAKDEFTFDYKLSAPDNSVLAQAVTKAKTKKDGEDVLSSQIKDASANALAEIAKKRSN